MSSHSTIIACLLASSSDNSVELLMIQPMTAKNDVGIKGAQEEA
jgi:hypothetical protein